MKKTVILNPTLACADRMNMGRDVDTLTKLGAEIFHLDIMDGNYVPNLCLDFDTMHGIKNRSEVPLDIHLMVTDPFVYLDRVAELEPEYLSFHIDATPFPIRLIGEIKKRGMKAGIVLNPGQPVAMLDSVLDKIQLVQVMSVEPGFSGQGFLPDSLDKIETLSRIRSERHLDFVISVDGGIDVKWGKACAEKGADMIIVGALAVFFDSVPLEQAYEAYKTALNQD